MQQMYQSSVLFDWLRVRGLGLDRKVIGWLGELLIAGSCFWFNFFLSFYFLESQDTVVMSRYRRCKLV